MKKVLLSIFLVLILSSCSIDWNWEKDKKITEQNNQILKLEKQVEELKKEKENDLFEKKQECAKYNKWWDIQVYYNTKYNSCVESYCINFWTSTYDCIINDYFTQKFYLQYKCEWWELICLDKYK